MDAISCSTVQPGSGKNSKLSVVCRRQRRIRFRILVFKRSWSQLWTDGDQCQWSAVGANKHWIWGWKRELHRIYAGQEHDMNALLDMHCAMHACAWSVYHGLGRPISEPASSKLLLQASKC